MSQGMIYIFTGDGKGKTSAALGAVLRGLSHGWRVGWVSWYKEASWGISEHNLHTILSPEAQKRLQFFPMGKGFYLPNASIHIAGKKITKVHEAIIVDDDSTFTHKKAAHDALQKVTELLKTSDLVVMDEVCNAISDGLIKEKEVLQILKNRKRTHVILTGRNASPKLMKTADLVSSITKIKHPFDVKKLAVKGLDF